MTWALTDRVTRINFYATLALAGVGMVPLLMGGTSVILMFAILILLAQAWRLAMARQVHVRIDQTGVTKTIGTRTWRLDWSQATGAGLIRFAGSVQLVLSSSTEIAWNSSDKLYYKLKSHDVAAQVPEALLPELREFFVAGPLRLDDLR